tara:strand:+ start:42 stop:518 length:477 start_codon:yes stop_codon:yes gene_type:complete
MKPKEMYYEIISELFKYDEVNGGVVRIDGKGRWHPKPDKKGYISYHVLEDSGKSREYREHRLVYLLNNPDMDQSLQIDHINSIRSDNRIENLRTLTNQENQFNRPSTLGFFWSPIKQRYVAKIKVDYKSIHLGNYDNILDARAAYLRAKKKYHKIEER